MIHVIPKSPNMMFFDQASSEVPVPAEAALATWRRHGSECTVGKTMITMDYGL